MIERFVGLIWSLFAALAIFVAIVVSALRIALPSLDNHHAKIETWLSDFIDRPVHIGAVSATWRGWSPVIEVADLVLLNSSDNEEIVRFDTGAIDISIVDSLRNGTLEPSRLFVHGMRVALQRNADGTISVAGMPPSRWPVAQWLLQQPNFELSGAEVSFSDQSTKAPPTVFNDVTIKVVENGERQFIRGRLRRDSSSQESINFALYLTGDLLSSEWAGELFVEIKNLSANAAIDFSGLNYDAIKHGILHARMWSTWDKAKLRTARFNLDGSDIRFATPAAANFEQLTARGSLAREKSGWSLNFDHLGLRNSSGEQVAQAATRWRHRSDNSTLLGVRASNLDIATMRQLIPDVVVESALENFDKKNVGGTIKHAFGGVALGNERSASFFIDTEVDQFIVEESDLSPAISGLDFAIVANALGGAVDFAQTTPVDIASVHRLRAPVSLDRLEGRINWHSANGDIELGTDSLRIDAETISTESVGRMRLIAGASSELDLVTQISTGDLSRLRNLIPLGALPTRGERWLSSAFNAGNFAGAKLLFRGPTKAFPFDHQEGVFRAIFDLRGVELRYGKHWPLMHGIDATVTMNNRQTATSVHAGTVYTASVAGAEIAMPNLFTREPIVQIRGKTRVEPDELGRFIKESPLHKSRAARYADVTITNKFDMTLDMSLGLYAGGEKDVLGLVEFVDNRISYARRDIVLDNVHGNISFTRQDWYGEGLQATFNGDRVGVLLNGGLDDPNYDTEFRMTGTSDATQLVDYIDRYAPVVGSILNREDSMRSFAGKLPWKAVMTIPQQGATGAVAPLRLRVESSLLGLDVDFPWPFHKSSSEKKPLALMLELSDKGTRKVGIDYGHTADLEFDQVKREDGTFETVRAEFIFGAKDPVFSGEAGLSIRGHIGRLPLAQWIAFSRSARNSMIGTGPDLPVVFDVNIDRLEALGREFEGAHLAGSKHATNWEIAISSPQALGKITVPRNSGDDPWQLDFERLWLSESDPNASTSDVIPQRIPQLDLTADSLHYGDLDLGRATLSTRREENGLRLEKIEFSQSNFELNGTGRWVFESGIHHSQVKLKVDGSSLAGLLKAFNYEVANIEGGATSMAIAAGWGGRPSEFTLDKLLGNLSLHVEKGRFLDIEPGGGRLFGLLSLQTLPRRLSLDFNDLFSKGFSFDSIDGSFELDHGNAYTNSLLMNGPAARIDVAGRTGLAAQDYDQRVTVTPALSNTIPVASALFGPAGIGVGAVIYLGQKMFKSIPENVDKFLSREYSITGEWTDPIIDRI